MQKLIQRDMKKTEKMNPKYYIKENVIQYAKIKI